MTYRDNKPPSKVQNVSNSNDRLAINENRRTEFVLKKALGEVDYKLMKSQRSQNKPIETEPTAQTIYHYDEGMPQNKAGPILSKEELF